MKKAAKFELEFLKKEKVAKATYSFYFKKPNNFNFKSGQYLKIFLEIKKVDERGTSRYFTISSSPQDRDFITITTRIIKSSFKRKFKSLVKGDTIKAFGPLGYFNFDVKNKKQKVFLAGGIGITPFHSIIRYVHQKNLSLNVILIVSFTFKDEAIFHSEFKNIESRNTNIKTVYTLTKEKKIYSNFERGRIDEKMIRKYVQDHKQADFFIVGPEAFEASMIAKIKKMGISQDYIFSENFPGY